MGTPCRSNGEIFKNYLKPADPTPYNFISEERANEIDEEWSKGHEEFIAYYEKEFKDSNNLLARSHYAGSIFNSRLYSESSELAVYHFSLMLHNPYMMKWVDHNVNYMLGSGKFDWEKVYKLCQNQNELNMVLSVESFRHEWTTHFVLQRFIDLGGDINSKYFKILLLKAISQIESYFYTSKKIDSNFYLDFKDFKDFIYKIQLDDKILLHILRGYVSFLDDDFYTAKNEYKITSTHIKNATKLSKKRKLDLKTQIKLLENMIGFYSFETQEEYESLTQDISKSLNYFLNKVPERELEPYFQYIQHLALSRNDLITAYQFSNSQSLQTIRLLEVSFELKDLLKLYDLINNRKILFPKRFPINHKYIVTESIALRYFRSDNFSKAKKYLKLLSQDSLGLKTCRYDRFSVNINSYFEEIKNEPYLISYYDYGSEFLMKKNKIDTYNKLSFLNKVEGNLKLIDSIETELNKKNINSNKELSILYFELNKMYAQPFWAYSCGFNGRMNFTLYSSDEDISYLKEYSSIERSVYYLKKAISYIEKNEKELLAHYNFELLRLYKERISGWFNRDLCRKKHNDNWEEWVECKNEECLLNRSGIDSLQLYIDSVYVNTNYYKDVIYECFYPNQDIKDIKKFNGTKDTKKAVIKRIFLISFLIFSIIIFIFFYKKQKNNKN